MGRMREEGVPPPAVASDPALRRPLEAPAAEHGGLRVLSPAPPPSLSLGLAGHKWGRPATAASQGDRGEGRLQSAVTSRQNNGRAVCEGGRKLRQLITGICPCERARRSAAAPGCTSTHSHRGWTELGSARSPLHTVPGCAMHGDLSTFVGP